MKTLMVTVDGKNYEVTVKEVEEGAVSSAPAAAPISRSPEAPKPVTPVAPTAPAAPVAPAAPAASAAPAHAPSGNGQVETAPIQGKILRVEASVGDQVEAGDVVMILEAMKMENEIMAPTAGTIGQIFVSDGETVDAGADLYSLE